jgi:hypothetical protein
MRRSVVDMFALVFYLYLPLFYFSTRVFCLFWMTWSKMITHPLYCILLETWSKMIPVLQFCTSIYNQYR